MNDPSFFDAERAYRHIENLCFPRRVGTPRERRAARYILREFASLGLNRTREAFPVFTYATDLSNRLVIVLSGVLLILGAKLGAGWPLVSVIAWGLAAILVNAPWCMDVSTCFPGLFPTSSHNLMAALPDTSGDAPARVIFMAHYDTKSQWLPTGLRVGLVVVTTALCGLLILLGLAAMAGAPGGLRAVGVLSLVGLVLLTVLAVNSSGNQSPGALDNGSGVGALLELARAWRPRSESPVEAIWIATGSEEVGLEGARHFLRQRFSWLKEKPTLLINLESVGAGSELLLAGHPRTLRMAQDVSASLELPWRRLRVLGAGMDHTPFAARNLAAISILGDVVSHALAMHSKRDDMCLIERAALERAGHLAGHLAWSWAEMH